MRGRRHLIPLLAAVLVIQGLAALVPHQHGSAIVVCRPPAAGGGEAVDAVAAVHAPDRCFACSVHTPLVAPSPDPCPLWTRGAQPSIRDHRQLSARLSDAAGCAPRGPPRGL